MVAGSGAPNKGGGPSTPPRLWVASALAGLGAGLAFTLSPLTVVTLALVAALLGAAGWRLPPTERRRLSIILGAAIAVRVVVVAVLFLMSDHDSQATAVIAGDEAYSLSRAMRVRNILLGLPVLKHDYQIAFEIYGQTSYLSLLTWLQVLFGPSPYGLRLVNVLLFIAGAALLFRMARAAFGSLPAFGSVLALALLPTLLLWSISILKESLYFLLAASVVTAVYTAVSARRGAVRVLATLVAVVALWAISDLRGGAVYLVGGGVALGLIAFVATASGRWLAATAALATIAAAVALSQPMVRQRVAHEINQAAIVQVGHVFTVGHAYKTLDEGFYVTFSRNIDLTAGEATRYIVRSLGSFLVEPWPWTMGRRELVFLPEHVLWCLAILIAPIGVVSGWRRDRLAVCLLVGVMLPTVVVVAMTNGNVGTLIRFRGLVWPYALVFVSLGSCAIVEAALRRARARVSLEGLLERSLLAAVVAAATGHLRRSVDRSRLLRGAGSTLADARQASVVRRLQLSGVAVIAGVLVHTGLVQLSPAAVAPAMPALVWPLVLAAATMAVVGANPLSHAWPHSRLRGVFRS